MVFYKSNIFKLFLCLIGIISCICLTQIINLGNLQWLHVGICKYEYNSSVGAFKNIAPRSESVLWVEATGDYIRRLKVYNDALDKLRMRVLEEIKDVKWINVSQEIKSTWSNETYTYLADTSRLPSVSTLALAFDQTFIKGNTWHSESDTANLLVQSYYNWTGTDKLCSWLTSRTWDIPAYAWGAVFMKKCEVDLKKAFCRTRLEPFYLNSKRPSGPPAPRTLWPQVTGGLFPDSYYFTLANHVHYIQVIRHGVVDNIGDVFTGAAKLVQFSCSCANPGVLVDKFTLDQEKLSLYDEVFVVSQLYNHVLYHSSIEDLPRSVPYLQFLKNNKHIKIHTGPPNKVFLTMFGMLGISNDRFVTGVIRARIVYLPQLTPCGMNQVQGLQLTSHLLRQNLTLDYPDDKRDLIVLIKRSSTRRLTHYDAVSKGLTAAAALHKLTLHVLDDRKLPPVKDIFRLFRRAVAVVGPHGAGLLNLVVAEPGTYVVEGLCQAADMVLYYLWEAHTLGHRWHGVHAQSPGCAQINASSNEMVNAVKHYLEFRKHNL